MDSNNLVHVTASNYIENQYVSWTTDVQLIKELDDII